MGLSYARVNLRTQHVSRLAGAAQFNGGPALAGPGAHAQCDCGPIFESRKRSLLGRPRARRVRCGASHADTPKGDPEASLFFLEGTFIDQEQLHTTQDGARPRHPDGARSSLEASPADCPGVKIPAEGHVSSYRKVRAGRAQTPSRSPSPLSLWAHNARIDPP